MRKPPLVPTKRHRVVPCVLLVGNEPGLLDLCADCAQFAAGAQLHPCDVGSLTTRAAAWRPFALMVSTSVLEFDPDEFAALARTVNAELISVAPERIRDPLLKNELITALRNAFRRRSGK